MTALAPRLPMNDDGDIVLWKAIAGAKKSHLMKRPVFPLHRPNYSLDNGVLIRVKAVYRERGALPLDEEYARRK